MNACERLDRMLENIEKIYELRMRMNPDEIERKIDEMKRDIQILRHDICNGASK